MRANPLDEFLALLEADQTVRGIVSRLRAGEKEINPGLLAGSSKTLLLLHLQSAVRKPLLAVTPDSASARWLADDLRSIMKEGTVYEFPATELLPYEENHPDTEITSLRIAALAAVTREEFRVMVTPARALMELLPRPLGNSSAGIKIKSGSSVGYEELIRWLAQYGYQRLPLVDEVGQFSVRGGVIDFFPNGAEDPVRIELDDDIATSIRSFAPQTQRSLESLQEIHLLPGDEMVAAFPAEWDESKEADLLRRGRRMDVSPDQIDRILLRLEQDTRHPSRRWLYPLFGFPPISLLDLLPQEVLIYVQDVEKVEQELVSFEAEIKSEFDRRLGRGFPMPLLRPTHLFDVSSKLLARLKSSGDLVSSVSGWHGPLEVFQAEAFGGSLPMLQERLAELTAKEYRVWLSCDNEGQRERLTEILSENEGVRYWVGGPRQGFMWSSLNTALFADQDVFQRYARRRRRRRHHSALPATRLTDLHPGDFVVHVSHGVGRFEGLARPRVGGHEEECLVLGYRGGDKLYVPVEQSNLVDRYLGPDSGARALDSLGGTKWIKATAKVRRAVKDMAEELIRLYAARQALPGHIFPPSDHWQQELEASFPFQETPDQLKTWDEIREDMEQPKVMDRLVCGDVGYGKTELAVRAAFKAVLDGKQVAVLVPTTILAEQHYHTFRERMAEYPVEIEMLSRFRSPSAQRAIISDLKAGKIDIVIGTHRLLQKDVKLKDVGLVVIDEEQRFGVAHKEKLKHLRMQVDVLTMTATPIPRTLYMALSGARDMSVVNTPPQGRVPIRTMVAAFDMEIVAEAILREVSRGGQVYFVHNRVESINAVATLLRRNIPDVRFEVGHGQMHEHMLEDVMHRFLAREFDVLVCTMIIESGLDIPGVDTIIINRADKFGLAQLYQLRGRVGRGMRQAFAYLFIPGKGSLTSNAIKRLDAMRQFSELGSGLRLSLLDLEIRGVGNILGRDQHGHVSEVGFHLYCRMLEEEVTRIKEHAPPPRRDLSLQSYVPFTIPDQYVSEESMRLDLYRRLGRIREIGELQDLYEELRDRFGPVPSEVERFIRAVRLKLLLLPLPVEAVHWKENVMVFRVQEEGGRDPCLHLVTQKTDAVWRHDRRAGLRLEISLRKWRKDGGEIEPLLKCLEGTVQGFRGSRLVKVDKKRQSQNPERLHLKKGATSCCE